MFISGDQCLPLQIGAPPGDSRGTDSTESGLDDAAGEVDMGDASTAGDSDMGETSTGDDAIPDVWCEAGQPVAECVAYFALLDKCYDRTDLLSEVCQDAFIPNTDADVPAIAQLCADNLQRFRQACR